MIQKLLKQNPLFYKRIESDCHIPIYRKMFLYSNHLKYGQKVKERFNGLFDNEWNVSMAIQMIHDFDF